MSIHSTKVVWHELERVSVDLVSIFKEPELYELLCTHCKSSANIKCGEGTLERVFCGSCQIKLGHAPRFACQGRSKECMRIRFVDPIGRVSPLCRACHRSARYKV